MIYLRKKKQKNGEKNLRRKRGFLKKRSDANVKS